MGNVRKVVGWLDGEGWDGVRAAVPPLLIDRQCPDGQDHNSAPGFCSFQLIRPLGVSPFNGSDVQIEDNIGKMGRFEILGRAGRRRMYLSIFTYCRSRKLL